ncbi:MAG TPA: hypothetical protein VN848_10970, partial [Gemmatimonadales bacterium]|nr:hypothetical protein [Gemmatimonadales bacterium]
MTTPRDPHQWTVHVLNIQGSIFEKWVEHIVSAAPDPWKVVAAQYSVEYPPPNGPIRGHESCLDVWTELRLGKAWISLAIEAKKDDPRFVDWVFFVASKGRLNPCVTCIDARNSSQGRPASVTGKVLVFPSTIVADACREVRGTWDSKDTREFTKTSSKAISDAAHQVAIGVQALIQEQVTVWGDHAVRQGKSPPWEWNTFLPVIVTTANLKVLTFDPGDVDAKSGTLDSAQTRLLDVKWLVYLYPIPRHLQFAYTNPLHLFENDVV